MLVRHLFDLRSGMEAPSDVAVSGNGRAYVLDGLNNRVLVFDPSGNLAASFGRQGAGDGEFDAPLGITVGRSGRIYVADSGNHRVQILGSEGTHIRTLKVPDGSRRPADPTDVVVNENFGRCYVVDNDNHRILVFNLSNGRLIAQVGTRGTGELQFNHPFLAARNSEGDIFVVDVVNSRLVGLTSEGDFLRFVGSWGVSRGRFYRPKGVTVDHAGRIYVSDSYLGVIQVFDEQGTFIAAIGDPEAKDPRRFTTPVGLDVDDRKRLYIVEMTANRVRVYQLQEEAK